MLNRNEVDEKTCKNKMAQGKTVQKINDDLNNGLRVPGSNWAKYKSLITESKSTNPTLESRLTKSPRKRHRAKNYNQANEPIVDEQLKSMKDVANKQKQEPILTKQVALDCEMVGIGDGSNNMLARVSIVNKHGVCIYDKYVKPTEKIQDYRSAVSGIYPHHLKDAEDFKTVQSEVAAILKGRLLVGHAIKHDLEVLFLSHPRHSMRDTSRYKPFRNVANGNTPSLKKLAAELLGIDIQNGEHSSIEDARSTMQLYMLYRSQWERELRRKRH